MKIARYWTKGKAEARTLSGKLIRVTAWGWSALTQEEADRRADEASRRAARRIAAGEPLPRGYGYTDRPPREEIVEALLVDRQRVVKRHVARSDALDRLPEARRRVPPHVVTARDQLARDRQSGIDVTGDGERGEEKTSHREPQLWDLAVGGGAITGSGTSL